MTSVAVDNVQPKIKAPLNLKRRSNKTLPLTERVQLDKVLGLTVSSTSGLCTSEATGLVAYPAGCVVILFNPRRNKQSFLINQSKKAITAVSFSPDGKFLVTGECGHLPNVRIWDVGERIQVAEFASHKFAINCVAFSPNNKYVVSIGSQHDMIVNVWNWRTNTKVASNKVACQVKALAFADNGSYFVTVGMRHVKFWYLDYNKDAKAVETVPLMGRSAILGEQRNNNFCDVACGRGQMADSTYTITQSGLLCEFNSKRLLDKWVELRTNTAQCLSVGVDAIFCGCSDGIVRVFSPFTLHFIATLPRPHYLGVDVAAGLSPSHMIHPPEKAKYPDTMAVVFNSKLTLVTAVYNDHSLYVWDVANVKKVGKVWSSLYHSSCIWGVEVYPVVGKSMLPPGTFITCSSDDTIRFWNLEMHMSNETDYKRNIYSSELIKVLYIDKDLQFLTDKEWSPGSNKSGELDSVDGKNGVRSLRVSANGQHLASGDRSGNIRVHELQHMEEMCKIEAHDAEVLYLEYSKNTTGDRLLASASRDRLIHVFDVDEGYAFQQTLDDHSSSITAVRFTQSQNELKMFSCSADKSIIFRTAHYLPDLQFVRNHHVVGKTNMYDMDVDPTCKQIATACQDRNIRVYDVATGKQKKCFKGALGEDGALIKISLDPSGLYVSTSCSDKNISLYDFFSGECMASSLGHSELVTGLRFTSDCKHLISVSGDGCIFVWKINPDFVRNMQIRLAQLGRAYNRPPNQSENRRTTFLSIPNTIMSETEPGSDDSSDLEERRNISKESFSVPSKIPESSEESLEYRFSMGQVPAWAKKQISSEQVPEKLNSSDSSRYQPRGRWGQQASDAVKVKSIWDEQEDPSLSRNQFRSVTPGVSPIPSTPGSVLKRRETISGTPTRSRHLSSESTDADDEAVMNAKNRQIARTPNRRRISDTNAPTPKYCDMISGNLQASKFTAKSLMNLSNIGKKSIDQTITMAELSNLAKSLQDLSNLNLEDLENDDSQEPIVFQLPNEDESGETSFKVIEISPAVLREALRQQKLHGAPLAAQEDTRIDTDSLSEEDRLTDDSSSVITTVSVPSTPSKVNKQFFGTHLEKEHMDKEKYIKSGYSDLSLSKEKFGSSVECVEKAVDDSSDHRLSISARFLQKSQNGSAKRIGYGGSGDRSYSPKATVSDSTLQKRTEELGKAMEATRKRLESLGWKGSRGKLSADTNISGDYERETPSPPTKDTPSESELLLQRAKSLPDVSAIGTRRRVLPPTPSDSSQSTAETRSSRMKRSSSQQDVNKPARSPSFTGSTRSGGVPSYAQSTSSSQAKMAKSRSITNLPDASQDAEPKKPSRSQQRYKRLSFMTAKSTPNLATDVDKKTVGVDDQQAKEDVSVTVTRRASMSASAVEGKSRQERVAEMLNKQPPIEIRADAMSRVTENVSITTKRPPMVPPRKKAVPGERSPMELPVKDTSPSPVRKGDMTTSATYSSSPVLTRKTPDRKQRHHEMSPQSEKDPTVEICIEQLQNATQNAICMYDKVVQSEALKKEEKLDKLRRLALSFQQTQDVIARCASKHLDSISLTELNALQDSLAKRASDPDTSAVMLQQYNSLLFNLRVHKMQSSPASDV